MNNLQWIEVISSAISRIAYVENDQYLYVEFTGGRTCLYKNVPINEYENLLNAPSHGEYFSVYIRNAYPFEYV